jgi:3-deoxy-7-phosphoheptulonate synthase
MLETKDLRIVDTTLLKSPNEVTAELPLSERTASVVFGARQEIQAVLHGDDRRPLVIVGPCSIHDPDAAVDYAGRLLELKRRYAQELLLVMRVYFEKPRTTVGWKGLINDPRLDGSNDIPAGIRSARRLLLNLAELGMPAATEMLDPIIPQYIADLVSWTAIGARTTESQTHREMASGLSMPVGFKNGTDGGLSVAINAMIAASRAHSFLGVDPSGAIRTRTWCCAAATAGQTTNPRRSRPPRRHCSRPRSTRACWSTAVTTTAARTTSSNLKSWPRSARRSETALATCWA